MKTTNGATMNKMVRFIEEMRKYKSMFDNDWTIYVEGMTLTMKNVFGSQKTTRASIVEIVIDYRALNQTVTVANLDPVEQGQIVMAMCDVIDICYTVSLVKAGE